MNREGIVPPLVWVIVAETCEGPKNVVIGHGESDKHAITRFELLHADWHKFVAKTPECAVKWRGQYPMIDRDL